MGQHYSSGYSASVRMTLRVGQHHLPISHAAADFLITAAPVDLPPGPATLRIVIDDTANERDLFLPHGIRSTSPRTPITPVAEPVPF